jgi:acyl-CoA synthetase (AMP-forming)/AMP-acid ligase II
MLGYFGEPDVEDGWLPTGDLVEIEGDRIMFVGRTSDTINVGGVKVHPLPVEEVAGAVDGVELVQAYAHPSPVTGQIVALDVVLRPGADQAKVKEGIRTACSVLSPAAQPRRIHFVDEIKIRGHKIVRAQR